MNKSFRDTRSLVADAIDSLPQLGRRKSGLALLGWFVAGAVVGSAAMYLLDPSEGKKRRTQIRQRGIAWKNDASRLAEQTARGWKESTQGLIAKISEAIPGWKEEPESLEAKAENSAYLH
ncbi:MAG: YtxH domain-containing protein [Bacteriovoracia bacterium]